MGDGWDKLTGITLAMIAAFTVCYCMTQITSCSRYDTEQMRMRIEEGKIK